jgi:hypothetical protein
VYRGKVVTSIAVTPFAKQILEAAKARTGRSWGDVVEHLLRQAGGTVSFGDQAESTSSSESNSACSA